MSAQTAYEHLDIRMEGEVAWATMNRPDRLNALNPKLVDELRDFFVGLYWRRDVRVVVLQGAGNAFCAGLDLKERSGDNAENISSTVVSVGKRINSRLTMNYEQSLDGLEQVVKAIYQLTPKIRVEETTGSSNGLDVFYTLEYD